MKVALYYPWIYLRSGVEKTILELTERSRHSWTIFTSHFEPENTFPEFKQKNIIELKKVSVKRSYIEVLRAAITIMFQRIGLKNYDILWVHSEGLGDLITFSNHQIPVVCFCHTPLKVIHDPLTQETYLKNNRIKRSFFILFSVVFKLIDRMAWGNYNYVFCSSQEVRRRIIKAGLAKPDKIEVIYRGIDTKAIIPTWNYQPYFFHPTRIKWWKNVELSIEAFNEFQHGLPGFNHFKLIIGGQVDEGSKSYYRKLLNMCHGNDFIQIIPNPSQEELNRLYESCLAVLNTTLNEDWGIVILEAMAYGKPVIAVNRGGPKESIIDKKTGFLVEPNAKSFAWAMGILAGNSDLVLEAGRQARRQSLKYNWENFVKRIDSYIDSLKY